MWSLKTHGYADSYCLTNDAISGHGSTVAASSFTEDLLIPTEIRGYDYVIGDVRKGDQQGEDCMKNSCYQLGLDAPRKNTVLYYPGRSLPQDPTSLHRARTSVAAWHANLPPPHEES
ncbi:hypothetical protein CFC21_066705 [Triticum aestivum]|uniref:Uncharacterized protein n=4 Tax=Triticum TaxID=4564 RepID=A0A9R0TUE6_TRITD|nr:hypothetical protein TRIUR3_01120 [Triticum urartu]KAF7059853.1 hypothetical protein CFC21_066705 [Triticum aestivum]VAI19703.1 unnamed protein product [Triticum turgidum subsp. durum]